MFSFPYFLYTSSIFPSFFLAISIILSYVISPIPTQKSQLITGIFLIYLAAVPPKFPTVPPQPLHVPIGSV